MKTTSAAALAAAAAMMGAVTGGAVSEPTPVFFSPHLNRCWETVFTNEVSLEWAWHTKATSAQLGIVGMNSTFATNFTEVTSNYLWRAFSANTPSAEDVYDLTLTFYGSGYAVVGVLTSRMVVVTGAFGEAAVDPGPSEVKWVKVEENVVIPYNAGWAEATHDATSSLLVIAKTGGVMQTNALTDACGYFGWKIRRSDWGYGTFNLALTFSETVTNAWDAVLVRVPDGMMFSVR